MVLSHESRDAPRPWEGAGGWTASEGVSKDLSGPGQPPNDGEILRLGPLDDMLPVPDYSL